MFTIQDDPFYNELKRRVNTYLASDGRTRYAGPAMWAKSTFLIAAFFLLGALVYCEKLSSTAFVAVMALWMFNQFLMTIGIVHDAAHYCYARSRKINRRMMYLFDLLGINSEHWIENHVHSHHGAPNVPLQDSAIESFSLVRLHPKTKRNFASKHQHLYIFAIYSVTTIFQVYFLEFVSMAQGLVGFRLGGIRDALFFFAQKMFVMSYSLLLPLWILPNPKSEILLGWVLGHMMCGIAIGIIFMTTHLHRDTEFIELTSDGLIQGTFATHILRTTADVGTKNALYTWISGGLNLHVAHHLFPTISQIHLPAITRIVRETAQKHGVPYYEYTLWGALRSHVELLKKLGNLPDWMSSDQETPKGASFELLESSQESQTVHA